MLEALALTSKFMAALLLAQSPEQSKKEYELKYEDRSSKGQIFEIVSDESSTSNVTIRMEGQPDKVVRKHEVQSLRAKCEILNLKDQMVTETRWTFSKARRRVEGDDAPFWFQGMSFRIHHTQGAKLRITHENGSALISPDHKELERIMGDLGVQGNTPANTPKVCIHKFLPSKPVRVGESWKPAIDDLATMFDDPELKDSLDPSKSEVHFTLKSVESRGGSEFARIEGAYTVTMNQIGQAKLDQGIPIKAIFEMEFCIGGNSADEKVKMALEFKGASAAKVRDKPGYSVEMDAKATAQRIRKSVP